MHPSRKRSQSDASNPNLPPQHHAADMTSHHQPHMAPQQLGMRGTTTTTPPSTGSYQNYQPTSSTYMQQQASFGGGTGVGYAPHQQQPQPPQHHVLSYQHHQQPQQASTYHHPQYPHSRSSPVPQSSQHHQQQISPISSQQQQQQQFYPHHQQSSSMATTSRQQQQQVQQQQHMVPLSQSASHHTQQHHFQQQQQQVPLSSSPPLAQQQQQQTLVNTNEQKHMLSASKDVIQDIISNFEENFNYSQELLVAALNHLASVMNTTPEHRYYYVGLAHLCKLHPRVFASEIVIQKMIQILSTTPTPQSITTVIARKTAGLTRVLLVNILMRLYAQSNDWPLNFVRAFVDDSLGERLWVDSDSGYCRLFIANILTIYQSAESIRQLYPNLGDEESIIERFSNNEQEVIAQTLEYTVAQVRAAIHQSRTGKRRNIESHIIRLCISTASLPEIRLLSSSNLESWLNQSATQANQVGSQQAPVLKQARDLLQKMTVYMQNSADPMDHEAFNNLVSMKLKSVLSNYYLETISKMMVSEGYQAIAIQHFLTNECQSYRNATSAASSMNYFKTFIHIYRAIPEHGALQLGHVLQGMAATDQYQPHLRPLIRRIVKNLLPLGLDFVELCSSLLTAREQMIQQPLEIREKWINCLVDLVCFVCASCKIYYTKDMTFDIYEQVSTVCSRCMEWCKLVLPTYLPELSRNQYVTLVTHFLFLKPPHAYLPQDNIIESEKNLVQAMINELPVQESTILDLEILCLTMGRLSNEATLDILFSIIHRAAFYSVVSGKNCLMVRNTDIVVGLLQCTFSDLPSWFPQDSKPVILPESIVIAIRHLFWRSCKILLILTSFNSSISIEVMKLPTMKLLVESTIKNQLPDLEKMHDDEHVLEYEREMIQYYSREMYDRVNQYQINVELFKNGVSDLSPFLNYFMSINPYSDTRIPPVEEIGHFIKLEKDLRLGSSLRNSRDPDLLSDVMKREGSLQSLSWLTSIIHNDISTLSILPAPILCELFLASVSKKDRASNELITRMIARLCEWLFNSSVENSYQVLSFFTAKLADPSDNSRRLTKQCLRRLLGQDDIYQIDTPLDMMGTATKQSHYGVATKQYSWMNKIPTLICWPQFQISLWNTFTSLLKCDTDISFIAALTEFMYVYKVKGAFDISLVLSDMIINRQYLSREIFSTLVHALPYHSMVQRIFVEAYMHIQNDQAALSRSFEPSLTTILRSNEGREICMPTTYLQGLISFVLLPLPPTSKHLEFSDPMITAISSLFGKGVRVIMRQGIPTDEVLLTDALAKKLLLTNSSLLIRKALESVSVEGMIQVLCSFGASEKCVHFIKEAIHNRYLQTPDGRQHLGQYFSRMNRYELSQLIDCLGENKDDPLYNFVRTLAIQSEHVSDKLQLIDDLGNVIQDSTDSFKSSDKPSSRVETTFVRQIIERGLLKGECDELHILISALFTGAVESDEQYSIILRTCVGTVEQMFINSDQTNILSSGNASAILVPLIILTQRRSAQRSSLENLNALARLTDIIISALSSTKNGSSSYNVQQYILSTYYAPEVLRQNKNTSDLLSISTDVIPVMVDSMFMKIGQVNNNLLDNLPRLVQMGSGLVEAIIHHMALSSYDATAMMRFFDQIGNRTHLVSKLSLKGVFADLLIQIDPAIELDSHRDIIFTHKRDCRLFKSLSRMLMCLMIQNLEFSRVVHLVESRDVACVGKFDQELDEDSTMQLLKSIARDEAQQNTSTIQREKIALHCIFNLMSRGHSLYDMLRSTKYVSFLESFLHKGCVEILASQSHNTDHVHQLLLWLYTCDPDSPFDKYFSHQEQEKIFSDLTNSDTLPFLTTKMDKMMHRIGRVLMNQQVQYNQGALKADIQVFAHSLLRQTAFRHPYIVLRYLNSILALLEPVDSITLGSEIPLSVITVYTQVLSIMDALRPNIFTTKSISELLTKSLGLYFELLNSATVAQHDALLPLVSHFIDFLGHYILNIASQLELHDARNIQLSKEVQFLSSRCSVLIQAQNIFSQVATQIKNVRFNIDILLGVIIGSKSKNKRDVLSLIRNDEATYLSGVSVAAALKFQLRPRDPKLKETLHYLDEHSQYSPSILESYIDSLLDLIMCEPRDDYNTDSTIRLSYLLIIRYLKTDSKQSYDKIVPVYLKCLMHRNHNVRLHAIQCAPELFPFCNEFMPELLYSLFINQEKSEAIATLIEIMKMYVTV